MQHEFQVLMLGCALMLTTPAAPTLSHQIRHTGMVLAAAAAVLEWRDFRVALVCSEGNPAAPVCLRSYGKRPLQRR